MKQLTEVAEIIEADLQRADHQQAVLALTEELALDPMAAGVPLPTESREQLIAGLQRHPTTVILLAYLDRKIVGMATCFQGFSTFLARPLLNIHDMVVTADYQGRGIGQQLLAAVEHKARELGCCKVTLEVHENNVRAQRSYARAGYAHAGRGETMGGALFYTKKL